MASDIKLALDEDLLGGDVMSLECEGYEKTDWEDVELLGDYTYLMLNVHRDTGAPTLIELEQFRETAEVTVRELREHPLPWTFSLASLGIKEKPLEDVILAAWKKFKGIKMEWE